MNLADSSGIKTPELVHLRNSPVNTYEEPGDAHVAAGVSDNDRGRRSKLRNIGGATATHDDQFRISGKQRLKQLDENIGCQTFRPHQYEKI